MSQEMRFDLEARVEIFVTADSIREHADFAAAMLEADHEKRIQALKEIALCLANARMNWVNMNVPGIEITAYPTLSGVNIDRINWQELATP